MFTHQSLTPTLFNDKIFFNDYFILISPPDEILEPISIFKWQLDSSVGSYPSRFSTGHITLLRFLGLAENEKKLLSELKKFSQSQSEFSIEINGFNCFESSRTLYADIVNKNPVEHLHRQLIIYVKQHLKGIKGEFKSSLNPHITIGKELTESQFPLAKEIFLPKKFSTRFSCQHITILKRDFNEHSEKLYWKKLKDIPLGKICQLSRS